jgi:Ser/Thr protein kinase RdoA (MazF antagonist)
MGKPVMNDIIAQVLTAYGVEPVTVAAPESGYRNHSYRVETRDGRRLNLILYKSEPGIVEVIRRANRVGDYVAAQGLPARKTADPRILQLRGGLRPKYASLYEYLPGETISWEAYTRRHLKALGAAMSDLHSALAGMPSGTLPKVAGVYGALMLRVQAYFEQSDVRHAAGLKLGLRLPRSAVRRALGTLAIAGALPGVQPLHMDFVRGNVLFEGPHITGILDFEKAASGPRVFDLARTLAFLLVDSKYKDERHVRKFFLESGYNKRGALPFRRPIVRSAGRELDVLEGLVDMFLVYDLYKFLRHNPYESLLQNEHYVRTVRLLERRGVLVSREPIAA